MASTGTSSQSTKLEASTFQRLHPRAYFERFLAEGIRTDGREALGWRGVNVNVGSISTADGSALVRLGDTTIVCGVKAEIAQPNLERPDEGFIVPNIDLPAICSPKFKPGAPGEEAQVISDRINEILLSSGVIPLSSLCIHPKKAAWVLYIDATCINYDGNVIDATLIAVMAALKNTRIPVPTFDEEAGTTICSRVNKVSLTITRTPLSASFAVFDGTHLLADPSAFEEPLIETSVTVVVDEHGELASVTQVGVGSLAGGSQSMSECIKAAKQRRRQLGELVGEIS
ncbi:hypothetical protein BOTBODRAFT_158330 [Botryobasidium botryosum FD-172 SS1]|uniref:Ribosomal RNA-processing protein 43 n=1 Tax=Botryobasidium botryosum (strain FD-172 SS1) TaxID=930990 RepID=A0A067MI72_BOTB1|nr:hypothetical protein BOTBODRAFT_158330 [Botryobasidium botryosum FD-172 SS1]